MSDNEFKKGLALAVTNAAARLPNLPAPLNQAAIFTIRFAFMSRPDLAKLALADPETYFLMLGAATALMTIAYNAATDLALLDNILADAKTSNQEP